MKIFTRLLLAHTLPVAFVSIALALTLVALTRMTALLQEVTDVELHSLALEGEVHHSAWLLDIALGHAHSACTAGTPTERIRKEVRRASDDLAEKIKNAPETAPELLRVAGSWTELARRVEPKWNCEYLSSSGFHAQVERLDDELTDLWTRRLNVLHAGVASKEAAARAIGGKALRVGGIIAVLAALVATFAAWHLAKTLSLPLVRLAVMVRRVGTGDFSSKIEVDGPGEIRTLAREFERMREELAQLEQLKQNFLASVSHELRTPLSKLREALALLDDGVVGEINPEQKRILAIARAASEREIRMVSTLLHLSRLRAGSPIRRRAGRGIDDVIKRAVADEKAELGDRDVSVELELSGPPPMCFMDVELVERSIANLIRNALAVSQNGQAIRVSREVVKIPDRSEAFVQVTVSDDGPGVPLDIRDTVFNAFVTSAVPRSPKALGIGLGLALAREVALAHGGELLLDLTVERGATFHLLIPTIDMRAEIPQGTPQSTSHQVSLSS